MIEIHELTKRYGPTVAVDGLSFDVQPGVVTGFLGPNGSGKSTTLRMLLGLDIPDAGTALIGGPALRPTLPGRCVRWGHRSRLAIDPGRTARHHLLALAAANRLPKKRVEEVLDMVGLLDAADRRAGGFSLGMSQRLGIAAALLGDPGVPALDEPVNGLDPDGIRWIRILLQDLAVGRAHGAAVQPPHQRDGYHCRAARRHRRRPPARRHHGHRVAERSGSLEGAFFDSRPGLLLSPPGSSEGMHHEQLTCRPEHSDSAYGPTDACRMEWLKLRTLRSNFGGLGLAILAAIGVSIAVGVHTQGTEDAHCNFLSGIAIGLPDHGCSARS